MRTFFRAASLLALLILLAGCEGNQSIVNSVSERDANEIVVFLASKGIEAQKVQAAPSAAAATTVSNKFDIVVSSDNSTEAMSLLNRNGLPRRQGVTLLELFASSGLMKSDKEETIRYQAGLAEQLSNTIRKFDGVLEVDVQLSIPSGEQVPGVPVEKTTAAVYVKHQGMLDDPNSHTETKIKRLLAGSVSGLKFDDVTVITDLARIADINLDPHSEMYGPKHMQQTYVSIWSVVMTKSSLSRFRLIFFSMIILILLLAGALSWVIYKFYPELMPSKKEKQLEEEQPPPPST
jgi:type III secretion protein J